MRVERSRGRLGAMPRRAIQRAANACFCASHAFNALIFHCIIAGTKAILKKRRDGHGRLAQSHQMEPTAVSAHAAARIARARRHHSCRLVGVYRPFPRTARSWAHEYIYFVPMASLKCA